MSTGTSGCCCSAPTGTRSLAAATLVTMGHDRAGDVTGGFRAWRLAGLPVLEAPEREDAVLPGMHPPDPVA